MLFVCSDVLEYGSDLNGFYRFYAAKSPSIRGLGGVDGVGWIYWPIAFNSFRSEMLT